MEDRKNVWLLDDDVTFLQNLEHDSVHFEVRTFTSSEETLAAIDGQANLLTFL